MPFFLLLLLNSLFLACNDSVLTLEQKNTQFLQKQLQDSLTTITIETQVSASSSEYEQNRINTQLAHFLKIVPATTKKLNPQDTLLTFHHDFSFAGFMGAKYTQLLRTPTMIQLTQVVYTNRGEEGDSAIVLKNLLTGQNLGKFYPSYYKQIALSQQIWQALMETMQAVHFFEMGQEDCWRMVLDGTFSSLIFHSKTQTHQVKRHNCPDQAFYQLARQIENLSPDPINL